MINEWVYLQDAAAQAFAFFFNAFL